MLGLDNPIHIAFILLLLLLVFGAKRLPEMGKSLGEGLRGFKDSITGDAPKTELSEGPVSAEETASTVAHSSDAAEHRPMEPVA